MFANASTRCALGVLMITPTQLPTARVRTAAGSEFPVRPVHPDDKWTLAAAFRRLSPQSRHNRFLVASDRLNGSQLAYLTELDFRDHVAWGALDGDEAVGVARFIRLSDEPTGADVALTIVDSHQGRGIGPMLLRVLGVSARSLGIARFHFDVLAQNRPMITVLDRFGAEIEPRGDLVHGVVDVQMIAPPDVVAGDLSELVGAAERRSAR